LQTAAIISKNTGLNIKIEHDLHEWLQDTELMNKHGETAAAIEELKLFKGEQNPNAKLRWESLSQVAERSYKCLYKYLDAGKIIVVCHGIVMRQFVYADSIPFCGVMEMEFDIDTVWHGWFE
jgi:broad specificity phosphatase PhoE